MLTERPTVTVVVPTRNRSAWLTTTLRSVLGQRQVALEVIVVDEASSDDTHDVIGALGDARVRVIRHDVPLGVSSARNRGAAEGRGDWLAFVDDDDLWAPEKMMRQIAAAESAGRAWAYCGAVNIGEGGHIISGRPPLDPERVVRALRHYNAIPGGGSNVIVRRRTWLEAGPFDTRLRNTEDWEMWLRLAARGRPACVNSPLVAYRVHTSNSSLNVAEIVRGTKLIEELHQTTVDWGRMRRWFAESYLRRGQHAAAIVEFARAAACGDVGAVLRDVGGILRHRVVRPPLQPVAGTASGDAWIATALIWLQDLHAGADVPSMRS